MSHPVARVRRNRNNSPCLFSFAGAQTSLAASTTTPWGMHLHLSYGARCLQGPEKFTKSAMDRFMTFNRSILSRAPQTALGLQKILSNASPREGRSWQRPSFWGASKAFSMGEREDLELELSVDRVKRVQRLWAGSSRRQTSSTFCLPPIAMNTAAYERKESLQSLKAIHGNNTIYTVILSVLSSMAQLHGEELFGLHSKSS